MKRMIPIILGIFLVFFGSCNKACQNDKDVSSKILRIGTNPNFPPYETINDKGELMGFDIDVGRALGEKLNRKVEFKEFDFDALILALNKGQIDIILSGMSITESRQKEIEMVPYQGEPMTKIAFLFWEKVPEQILGFDDIKRLAKEKNLSVTVQSGHFLEDFLRGENIPLKPLLGPPEQILDIKYDKSLAAAVDELVGKKLASEHPMLKSLILSLPKDRWDLGYGIGIKRSNTVLIEEVKKAVDALKADGTIKKLADEWLKVGH